MMASPRQEEDLRKLRRANNRMSKALNQQARTLYKDMEETKEYQEMLAEYETDPELEVSRLYHEQCHRLVSSVEGLEPWLAAEMDSPGSGAPAGTTTTPSLPFKRMAGRVSTYKSDSEGSILDGKATVYDMNQPGLLHSSRLDSKEARTRRYRK
jgi:hypothetical protein